MNEIKKIKGFNDYCVTTNGDVYSFKGNKPKLLKAGTNRGGYKYVNLSLNGKAYNKRVHRLVAEAFIPNPLNKSFVNHISKDKQDNSVDNLEWVTSRENNTHLHKDRNTSSKYVGVYYDKNRCKWYATIKHNNKQNFLGRHDTEEQAFNAYIEYCIKNNIDNKYASNDSI